MDDKNTLSIEVKRKGLSNEWKTEKFHTIFNATIEKSNLKHSVCFRKYVIIFEPEKNQAHVFDCHDPGKLRLVNLQFEQTDTGAVRVAAQRHNLVVFISESKIYLVDVLPILSAISSREDDDVEPATKKAKTDVGSVCDDDTSTKTVASVLDLSWNVGFFQVFPGIRDFL